MKYGPFTDYLVKHSKMTRLAAVEDHFIRQQQVKEVLTGPL
jgi:hypothetical protein